MQSKRGQTSCPGFHTSFNNRFKPENCDFCNYFLGGKYVPKEKKPKLNAPKSVKLFNNEGCSFFSAKTHSKDTRCIVIIDEPNNLKQCLAAKCKEIRAAFVNSGKVELFSREHTVYCDNPVPPLQDFTLTMISFLVTLATKPQKMIFIIYYIQTLALMFLRSRQFPIVLLV